MKNLPIEAELARFKRIEQDAISALELLNTNPKIPIKKGVVEKSKGMIRTAITAITGQQTDNSYRISDKDLGIIASMVKEMCRGRRENIHFQRSVCGTMIIETYSNKVFLLT